MAELLEDIGHNVRRLREEKGWNQVELSFHADTSPSIVSLIENGKRNPSTATLAKIAGALGVEVVDLFPKGLAPPPDFRAAAQPEEWQESLARLYKATIEEGRAALRTPKPNFERVRVFDKFAARLAEIHGPRDILGREADALAEAVEELEYVQDQIQTRLPEWFVAAPEEEQRSALEQLEGTEYGERLRAVR